MRSRGSRACGAVTKASTPAAVRTRPHHCPRLGASPSSTKLAANDNSGIEGTTMDEQGVRAIGRELGEGRHEGPAQRAEAGENQPGALTLVRHP